MIHQRFVMFAAMQTGSPERAANSSVNILELLGSLHAVGDGGVTDSLQNSLFHCENHLGLFFTLISAFNLVTVALQPPSLLAHRHTNRHTTSSGMQR